MIPSMPRMVSRTISTDWTGVCVDTGISKETSDRISEHVAAGIRGPILDLDDGGDGVRISIE
jgi:hypothetical protein